MYQNLRAEMARKNVTQKSLAAILGITSQAFWKKLKGFSPFTWDETLTIKSYLNVDLPMEVLFRKDA